ncbi:hypothetical protein EI94DRAFT_660451 [Lactarius quietus]|nr:hypothetical protein EI94DRAFT_660451 [Lactarius quietus]
MDPVSKFPDYLGMLKNEIENAFARLSSPTTASAATEEILRMGEAFQKYVTMPVPSLDSKSLAEVLGFRVTPANHLPAPGLSAELKVTRSSLDALSNALPPAPSMKAEFRPPAIIYQPTKTPTSARLPVPPSPAPTLV